MPANTPGGWPYVLPADHPVEYPVQSQQLATLLDTRAPANVNGLLTPATNWAEYGSPFAGLFATRQGGMVTIEAVLRSTTTITFVAGTPIQVASLPVGLRPVHDLFLPALSSPPGGYASAMAYISTLGTVSLALFVGGSMPTNLMAAIAATYRGA